MRKTALGWKGNVINERKRDSLVIGKHFDTACTLQCPGNSGDASRVL